MSEKPIALIVDDNDKWLVTLEETLESDYQVKKAKTPSEVTKIIDNKDLKIELALVDIRLNDEKDNDDSGLSVIFSLNKIGVPCIATTAYDHGDAIRAALMIGRAKDVWFKNERLVILKEKVEYIGNRLKEERREAVEVINFNKEFSRLSWNLLLIPIIIIGLFTVTTLLIPDQFPVMITFALTLILAIFGLLALFYNKITGEQFTQFIRSILRKDE